MKIKFCAVNNFGSYKEFNTDFDGQGLTLLHGKTGSGKSTIPDMVFWIMFGETAKGGSVDDIRNWQSEEATVGTLGVETNDGFILITRVRGKTSENDLYWVKNAGDEPIRGKDLKDTQRLLESLLGVSPLLYEIGAYSHEFSPIGGFFLAKAKDRRAIFEQVADLSLPKRLAEQASIRRKTVKEQLDKLNHAVSLNTAKIEQSLSQAARISSAAKKWGIDREAAVTALVVKSTTFETDKAMKLTALESKSKQLEANKTKELETGKVELERLMGIIKPQADVEEAILKLNFKMKELAGKKCKECGGPSDSPLREKYLVQLESLQKAAFINEGNLDNLERLKRELTKINKTENPYTVQIEELVSKTNTYAELISAKRAEMNPHLSQISDLEEDVVILQDKNDILTVQVTTLSHDLALLTKLYDLSFDVRGAMLQSTVKQAQDKTNSYMEKYFEGELRVSLTLEGSDSLQVELYKNGYNCGYKQLSKGQRGLLKLCFSVAIMESASNQSGVDFSTLFFDEALDGLDTEFKVKAFDLLQELSKSHSSIFVIDHAPEFQSLFDNQIHVTMEEDISRVDERTSLDEPAHDKERIGAT